MKMKAITLLAVAMISISARSSVGEVPESAGPQDLLKLPLVATFNPAGAEFFAHENGVLSAIRGEESRYIGTSSAYGDFLLTVEYSIEPSTNSGIYVRCENADTYTAQTCYEANIWDDNSNPENRTGSLISFAAPLVAIDSGDGWNRMSVRAEGDHIVVKVNDVVTAEITDDTYAAGYIALQYGGGNKMVRFRNLSITPL